MTQSIFIAVSHGMHVRNLLNSSVLAYLRRDFHVVILSFAADVPFLKRAFPGPGVDVVPFVRRSTRLEDQYAYIRRYLLSNPKRNRTINLFAMNYRQKRPFLYDTLMALNRILGSSLMARKAWLAFEAAMVPGSEYDELFARYRPAALVTANYGTAPDEIRLIRAARRAGTPSIAVVPSWDNLTTKGIIGAPADKLIVWNEIMRTEAVELHDYEFTDVGVAGGVQFDVYGDRSAYGTRDEFCARFGMASTRKIVVYGTITPRYFPYNGRIIEMLAQASRAGELGADAQILVRLHPQVIRDAHFGDRIEDYRRIATDFPGTVFLNVPEVEAWGEMSPPHPADGGLLGAMLHHADACVVPGSTLALDSLANGTPVVGVAFDGDVQLAYGQSIRRWYDFTYYRPLVELKGLQLAHGRIEMNELLRSMLADKTACAERRAHVVSLYLGQVDGAAGERIAKIIWTEARRSLPEFDSAPYVDVVAGRLSDGSQKLYP
jgi:hypothetical protein